MYFLRSVSLIEMACLTIWSWCSKICVGNHKVVLVILACTLYIQRGLFREVCVQNSEQSQTEQIWIWMFWWLPWWIHFSHIITLFSKLHDLCSKIMNTIFRSTQIVGCCLTNRKTFKIYNWFRLRYIGAVAMVVSSVSHTQKFKIT